ncbi:MAG TPA: hypothetical protein VMT30_03240 [Candidatus Saccharimonadia bacterium]|nr:hypothetical protein [Candidatus Saccharimonadia bacterium]
MASEISLTKRLLAVLLPTPIQAILAIGGALAFLVFEQIDQVLSLLGIGDVALNAAGSELHSRFQSILTSQVASSAALVTFWATIGLIAYLVCWSLYNVLIEARNEVTLETQYTNRGRRYTHLQTLGLKVLGAGLLLGLVALLKPGLALWLALWVPLLGGFTAMSVLNAFGAVLGLALHLYLILAVGLLTFTPWYHSEPFTDR